MDKTRTSKSAGVAIAFRDALVERDASAAWTAWSSAAERALVSVFYSAGGPIPPDGLVGGRGTALLNESNIGRSRVRRLRSDLVDPTGASEVHLFRDNSVAPPPLSEKPA